MVSRLDRLVLREIAGPFVFSVALFTSFFFSGDLMKVMDLLARGASPADIGRIFLLMLPQFVAWTLPMAMLLAALLGIGRLSNDAEIVAVVAAGVSVARILVPVGTFALGVALSGVYLNDDLVPAANRRREAIVDRLKHAVGSSGLGAGITLPIHDGPDGALSTLIHVEGGLEPGEGALRGVSIETWEEGVLTLTIYADRAEWIVGTRNWRLFDFWGAMRQKENVVTVIGESGRTQTLGTPDELRSLETRPIREISLATLRRRIRLLRASGAGEAAREAEVEVAQRILVPFAAFVFALVGAPLGIRSRRAGKGVGVGLAIVIIFAYWTALQLCAYLGKSGALPAFLALSLPNLVGIAVAYVLIQRVWIGER